MRVQPDRYRIAALALSAALLFAAATDYVPAFVDAEGRVFGLFRLDVYKDALHVASGLWAAASALSRRSAVFFLKVFGTLYFADGVMGVFTGSGETIYRTTSGRDLMSQLGLATPRLLCSLVHKFGRHGVDDFDADAIARQYHDIEGVCHWVWVRFRVN